MQSLRETGEQFEDIDGDAKGIVDENAVEEGIEEVEDIEEEVEEEAEIVEASQMRIWKKANNL